MDLIQLKAGTSETIPMKEKKKDDEPMLPATGKVMYEGGKFRKMLSG